MCALERSDSDTIIRMLYYCTEPRTLPQIMSYCGIDASRFKKFMQHCMKRDLLKMVVDEEASMEYVVTKHGAEVLATAAEIMGALGIEKEELD
ncbi:MAG TPA: winged helix-turn-helix domain-containing protein [Nitrososphaerales archaeon]|nr:winged helix-turn-helix domain-containing protein [Nitrososphaerales archaeon]